MKEIKSLQDCYVCGMDENGIYVQKARGVITKQGAEAISTGDKIRLSASPEDVAVLAGYLLSPGEAIVISQKIWKTLLDKEENYDSI